MKSLLFCMLGLAMTACAPRKAGNVNNGSDELAMLVGTYTDGNSKGIYTFRFLAQFHRSAQPVLSHSFRRWKVCLCRQRNE